MAYGTPFSALTLAVGGVAVVGLAMLLGELVFRAHRAAVDPEDSPEAAGEAAARRSAGYVSPFVRLFTSLLNTYVYLVTRFIPFGSRFWRGLAKAALYNYYKRSGGDAIGLNAQPTRDRVDLEPVKYLDGLGDLEERPGWKAKDRENTWETAPTGDEVIRWGKTPLVLLSEEAPIAGSMLDAHVATAIDRGDMRDLYHVEEGKLVAEVTVDEPTGGGPGAVADGGTQVWRDFEPQSSPIFRDMIVELHGDTALSWWNYKELLGEVTTSEQMQLQETRGFLAGLRPGKHKSFIIKVLLIAAGLAALGFIGPHIPQIINALFGGGGGGGGGGSVIPFVISLGVL